MRKTTQHYFYPIIIILLLAQYTHNEFNNAEVKILDPSRINEQPNSQNLQVDRNFLFTNKENKIEIAGFFREEQGTKRPLEIFVLKVEYKKATKSGDISMLVNSCRAYIENINVIETQSYEFYCFETPFQLKRDENDLKLYSGYALTTVENNSSNFKNFDYKKEEIEKVVFFFKKNDQTNNYLLILRGTIEGVTLNEKLISNKFDFKLVTQVDLFTINNNNTIGNPVSKELSVNLKGSTQILKLFDQNELDTDNFLNDVSGEFSLEKGSFKLTLQRSMFTTDDLDKKDNKNFSYSISLFQIHENSIYLFPSVINLSKLKDILDVSIRLKFKDQEWKTFSFFVIKKEKLFWPTSYDLDNEFKIVPELSSDPNLQFKIKLFDKNNEEIEGKKVFVFVKKPNEVIKLVENMDAFLMMKNLIDKLVELENGKKEIILGLVKEKEMTENFFSPLIENMKTAIFGLEEMDVGIELEDITGLESTEAIIRIHTKNITTMFNKMKDVLSNKIEELKKENANKEDKITKIEKENVNKKEKIKTLKKGNTDKVNEITKLKKENANKKEKITNIKERKY